MKVARWKWKSLSILIDKEPTTRTEANMAKKGLNKKIRRKNKSPPQNSWAWSISTQSAAFEFNFDKKKQRQNRHACWAHFGYIKRSWAILVEAGKTFKNSSEYFLAATPLCIMGGRGAGSSWTLASVPRIAFITIWHSGGRCTAARAYGNWLHVYTFCFSLYLSSLWLFFSTIVLSFGTHRGETLKISFIGW